MELIELKSKFEEVREKSDDLKRFMDLEKKVQRVVEIDTSLGDISIWKNPKKSTELLKEKKILTRYINIGHQFKRAIDDIDTYFFFFF